MSSTPSRGRADTETVLFTFISEPGTACTTSGVKPGTDQESILAQLAAPLLGGILSGALDTVGSAIKSASDARSKQWPMPASPVFVAQFNYKRGTIPSFSTSYKQFCVTAVAADISKTPVPAPAAVDPPPPGDRPSKAQIYQYIRATLGETWASHVDAIRFYTEIEVRLDTSSSLKQVYYEAQPTYAYFERALTGGEYKLGALQIDLGSVFEANKSVWTHTFSLLANPMDEGDLRTVSNSPIPASGLLPLPPVAAAELAAMKAMQDATTLLKATYGNEPPSLAPADAADLESLRKAILVAEREEEDAKCKVDSAKDKAIADLCLKKLTVARAYADRSGPVLLKRQQEDINATILALRGNQDKVRIAPYNASVTLTETRDANALGLAVAKILTDAKPTTDLAITNYVNGQLGMTQDASMTTAANVYRLARFDYDQAQAAYDAAKVKGDAAEIVVKQRFLIEKYGELLTKAEAAGERVTIPPPY